MAVLAIPDPSEGDMVLLGLSATLFALSMLPMAATPVPLLSIMCELLPTPIAMNAAPPLVSPTVL